MKVLSCEEQSTLDENFYPHKNPNIHKRYGESSTEKRDQNTSISTDPLTQKLSSVPSQGLSHQLPLSAAQAAISIHKRYNINCKSISVNKILQLKLFINLLTLNNVSSLFLTSKYSCFTCCKHLRHLHKLEISDDQTMKLATSS